MKTTIVLFVGGVSGGHFFTSDSRYKLLGDHLAVTIALHRHTRRYGYSACPSGKLSHAEQHESRVGHR